MTSYGRLELEIWQFHAGAVKNTQYNHFLNSRFLQEIGVEKHDGDIRFQTGSGNIAILRMHSE